MWRSLDPYKDSRSRGWPRDERGVVLLLVLLVLALISVLVLSWAQEWRTELQLAANFREASQCHRLAEAGVYYALGKLLEAKSIETSTFNLNSQEAAAQLAAAWRGDRSPHQLKLPGGLGRSANGRRRGEAQSQSGQRRDHGQSLHQPSAFPRRRFPSWWTLSRIGAPAGTSRGPMGPKALTTWGWTLLTSPATGPLKWWKSSPGCGVLKAAP